MITMHPGEYLSLSYVEPYKISSTELSERLGLPEQTIDGLLKKEVELTAEMAVRFELVLGRSAESWLGMQTDHSLMQARKKVDPGTVRPFAFPRVKTQSGRLSRQRGDRRPRKIWRTVTADLVSVNGFLVYGFKPGVVLPAFDNVDVYPLLMRLLDVAPLLPALGQ